MSCDGTMMGEPLAGCRILLVDIISTRASTCASTESGTCTAIWSPSKSALRGADQWMELNRFALDQNRFKSLNSQTMQRRRAVEQYWMLANHFVENIPHFRQLALDHFFGAFNRCHMAALFKLVVDKRLEQLEGHLFRQSTLMQSKFWADHDHRAAGVIDTFAEQILTETTGLAFEHIAQGF